MLNQVSWTTFFEIVIFLAAVYYLFVLFRYYGDDLRRLLKPGQADSHTRGIPSALRYEEPENRKSPITENEPRNQQQDERNESYDEANELIHQLKQCIGAASGKPFAPAVLIPQLKKIFRENPKMQHSQHRDVINELIVQECEKTGTALLTEEEVDQWWSD